MAEDLKQKTIHALSWSFLESLGVRGVQFVVGIVLARLLLPEQFGLLGMLTIFMAVAQSFLDSGFGAALIQKQDATQTDVCSIFYFNIIIGLAATGVLCFIAPWIAAFYDQPILTPLTRMLSLIMVINSFGLVQETILKKEISFKTQTKVSMIAGIMSGIIGITLALFGFGLWSLVVQQVSSSCFRTISLWAFSSWRPSLIFSMKSLKEMFGFGSRLLASDLLNQISENSYPFIIGKLFSAADLGLFTRASTLVDVPSRTLSWVVGRVTFPVFSSIQDDLARLKRGLKKALTALALVNFPMMVGLAVVARPLVLALLTEKWAGAILYVQLLSLAGLLYPLHLINLLLLQSLGRSDKFLRLEIIKKILIVINLAVTWQWGTSGIIIGINVLSIIAYYLNSYYTGILISYPFREQVRDLSPYLLLAMLMGMVVHAVGTLLFLGPWPLLLVQITTGIITYVLLCRILRLKAFMEIWEAMWKKIPLASAGSSS